MKTTKTAAPQRACEAAAKGHHVCECYGHTQDLPDYKKLSVPHTMQHYAKTGGCPCIPKKPTMKPNTLYCGSNPVTCGLVRPAETYRAYRPGHHVVYVEDDIPGAARDCTTGERVVFPNSRNYGGTARQRGFPAIGKPREATRKEREEARMYDRKEFLKAVLRDEMRDRINAEEALERLETDLGLHGSRHARALAAARADTADADSDDRVKTVAEQYDEVMDELRYVTRQPVGSKWNIIRMHYLLEEQDRLKYLREGDSNELKLYTGR